MNSTTKGSPTREVPTVAEPCLIRGVESLNLNSSPLGGYREKFGGNSPHNYGAVPKLPKLTLQHFTGDITKFCTFWEGFQSAVHNNPGLSSIDKFNYLKSILDGNAARAIQGLPLTEGNYEVAVKILQQRFGKKQQIISAHMEELWPRIHVRYISKHQGRITTLVESLLFYGSVEWFVHVGKNDDE